MEWENMLTLLEQINDAWENSVKKQMAEKTVGIQSQEYLAALLAEFENYKALLYRYAVSKDFLTKNDYGDEQDTLKKWYKNLQNDFANANCKSVLSIAERATLKNFWILPIFYTLKNVKVGNFVRLFIKELKEIIFHVYGIFFANTKIYQWHCGMKCEKRNLYRFKSIHYNSPEKQKNNYVINVFTENQGQGWSGGLCDRLRGITGTYFVCKEKNLPFRLFYRVPFMLEEFLVPNQYDWHIEESEVCFGQDTNIVSMHSFRNGEFFSEREKKFLLKKIKPSVKQTHVYTNTQFIYHENLQKYFWELFKPSERLQTHIDRENQKIEHPYISITCRFLTLIGDFNDPCNIGRLTEKEIDEYFLKLKNKIIEIYQEEKKKTQGELKVLVTSDSITFLQFISKLSFVHIIQGSLSHVDAAQGECHYENYEKSFLDLFMISRAQKVILLVTGKMFQSGFPQFAARIGGKTCQIVKW